MSGRYMGTASAPVSRNVSFENLRHAESAEEGMATTRTSSSGYQDYYHDDEHDPSPLSSSSEGTAVNPQEPSSSAGAGVRFAGPPGSSSAAITRPREDSNAGAHAAGGYTSPHLDLPAPQTEAELRRALGSTSAPASPGGGVHPALAPLHHSQSVPQEQHAQQEHGDGQYIASETISRTDHPDPAVAAGLIPPSEAEPQGGGRTPTSLRSRSKPGSGTNTPHGRSHHIKFPHSLHSSHSYAAADQHGFSQRGSHQAQHSKPLYSLARPLPTKEQRDMQKAYRDSVKAHVGPGAHHSAPTSRAPSVLLGPGAVHHAAIPPYGRPPGGHSHYLEPALPEAHRDTPSNVMIMQMLQQLLDDKQKQQSKKGHPYEGSSKDISTTDTVHNDEVKVDEPDSALARKEGFGEHRSATEKAKDRTNRAERRDSLTSEGDSADDLSSLSDSEYPNPWARFRHAMREPFAEFLGTMLLILFGTGVSLQYFLSLDPNVVDSPRGTYLSVSFGWGIGVGIGVWVAGGISGGHINPAVTIALAVFRGFPWKKVPGYILAQILGSTAGAGLNYALYRRAITIFEGGGNVRTISGTAGLFSTYPLEYMTDANAFFQEFVDTAILLITVLAISDSNNAAPPDGLNPLVLLFLIVGLGACMGMQTAYCLNPARDLGPRLVTWWAGYGRDVWNFRNQYWLWVPWCATISGGLMGCLIYDTLIYTGSESPLNMKWDWPWRHRKREEFAPSSKQKMPLGQTDA